MEQGKRYLVSKKESNIIREWLCCEVSENAFKVKDNVKNSAGCGLFTYNVIDIENPFWILKTEIDTLGKTTYQILEELKTV